MGRALRTMRRAQWQRVGRRASGAGLAWHIWQEQNVRVRERQDYVAHPVRRTWRSFCGLRDLTFSNAEPVSQNMQ
jgi:hypothetical protein